MYSVSINIPDFCRKHFRYNLFLSKSQTRPQKMCRQHVVRSIDRQLICQNRSTSFDTWAKKDWGKTSSIWLSRNHLKIYSHINKNFKMLVEIPFLGHKKIEQRRQQHSAPTTGHKSSVNFTITTFSFYIFGYYDKSISAYFRIKCAIFYGFNCGFSRYCVVLHCGE